MSKYSDRRKVSRIIDANLNRTKEGLRVCEEIARFLLDDTRLTSELKRIRHRIASLAKEFAVSFPQLLESRSSSDDVGRRIYANELERKDSRDIFYANIQRVKEGVRVLEEFSKLSDRKLAVKFKDIRYCLYEVEKKAAKKVSALFNHR